MSFKCFQLGLGGVLELAGNDVATPQPHSLLVEHRLDTVDDVRDSFNPARLGPLIPHLPLLAATLKKIVLQELPHLRIGQVATEPLGENLLARRQFRLSRSQFHLSSLLLRDGLPVGCRPPRVGVGPAPERPELLVSTPAATLRCLGHPLRKPLADLLGFRLDSGLPLLASASRDRLDGSLGPCRGLS
jgi:hypothetical protein